MYCMYSFFLILIYSFYPISFVFPVAYGGDGFKEYVLSRHFRDLPEQSIAYAIIILGGNIFIKQGVTKYDESD